MKRKKIYKVLTLFVGILILFSGKSLADNKDTSYLDDGVLDVGTSADFPPYEYYENDKMVGIDVEIMDALAKELGVEVKMHDMDFNNIIASIQSGKLDAGAAGFTVTEDRKKSVNFTDTINKTKQVIVVRKDSDIENTDGLKDKKIATQLGTVGDMYAKDDFGEENVLAFTKVPDAILALENQKVDAVIIDNETAKNFASASSKIKINQSAYVEEEYAIAVGKNNKELEEKLNLALIKLKDEGVIDQIKAKYEDNDLGKKSNGFFDRLYNGLVAGGVYKYLFDGLKTTLIVTFFALIISFVLGIFMAIIKTLANDLKLSWKSPKGFALNLIDKIVSLFITIIRGTPSTIQLLIMFNVILKNMDNLVVIAIISFALNSSAYMAELFRGGINSVPKGEIEAARSLGLSFSQTLKKITIPQAIKISFPALGNEIITLFKETSIAGFIGLLDLTRGASVIISQTFDAAIAYFAAAAIYLIIVILVEKIFKQIEKGYQYA